MNTIQVNSIYPPHVFTKLSPEPIPYTSTVWNKSFIKKFTTSKWPFEMYKGSLLKDFWLVLTS